MSKTDDIRSEFEAALLEVLKGRKIVDEESGEVTTIRPPAADLSVARAYLKDVSEPKKGDEDVPQTGKPTGALAAFARRKGISLPFAGTDTPQ